MRRLFSFVPTLLLWGMLALLAFLQAGRPPAPRCNDALQCEFSARRGFALLQSLLPNGEAHPTGSPANAALRERITAQFHAIGLEAEVHRSAGGPSGPMVENIIAMLPGQTSGPAAMIAAHYDSVAAGPGIGDDLSGVATVLEAARILKAEPTHRNPIVFLITDGEEQGLWGAKAFVREHPLARNIGAVVNLEARGTSGRSLMFQTSNDNAWLIEVFAKAGASPDTASIYSEVYRRLPHDTDLTVFHDAGVPGINLAFIGNRTCYHTAQDDLAHLDLGSFQHQGANALGVLREFAGMDLSHPPPGRAVYTDLLGLFVVRWPEGWTPAIALMAALVFCLAVWGLLRWKALSRRHFLLGTVAAPGLLLAPTLVALGLVWLTAGRVPAPWLSCAAVVLTAIGLVWRLEGRISSWGLWCGIWSWWAAATVAVAFFMPAASYLLLIPFVFASAVVLGALPAWGMRWRWIGREWIAVPAVLAELLWIKVGFGLANAVGSGPVVAITIPLTMSLIAFAPLWLRRDACGDA